MLDLLQDGAAVALFPQLRLRTQQGEQNRLFEDAKVFSQFVCIVDKKGTRRKGAGEGEGERDQGAGDRGGKGAGKETGASKA